MFDQFLGESSIHGLRYLTRDTGNLVRLVWLVFVGSSFGVAGYFIYLNVLDWENSPVVVTSVDDVMIEDKFPFPTLMLCPNDSNELNLVREFYNLHPEVGIDSLAQYNRLTVRKYLETAISGRRQALSDSNLPIEDGEVTKCLERNVTNVLEEGDCGVVKLLVALIDLQGNVFRATIVVKLYSEAVFLEEEVASNQGFLSFVSRQLGVSENEILDKTLEPFPVHDADAIVMLYSALFPVVSDDLERFLPLKPLSELRFGLDHIKLDQLPELGDFLADVWLFLGSVDDIDMEIEALKDLNNMTVRVPPLDNPAELRQVMVLLSHNYESPWWPDTHAPSKNGELGPCWAHVEDTTSQPYPDEYVCPDDGVCAEYCRQASLVRNFEDDLVRAFDTSFEKVREDLGLLQLPWCERGTDGQGTSQCWDQVITDRGPCYATKDIGQVISEKSRDNRYILNTGVNERGIMNVRRIRSYQAYLTTGGNQVQEGLVLTAPTLGMNTNFMDSVIQVQLERAVQTTPEFAALSIAKRQCLYPHEKQLKFFSNYSQAQCILECTWESASQNCQCVPWYLKRYYPKHKACLVFGMRCFNDLLSKRHRSTNTDCARSCLRDCDSLKLSTTSYKLDPYSGKTDSRPSSMKVIRCPNLDCEGSKCRPHTDATFACEFGQRLLNTSKSHFLQKYDLPPYEISMGAFMQRLTVLHVVVDGTTVEVVLKTAATTVIGMISNIGGILGLFCGMSILSVLETVYWLVFKQLSDK